MALPPVPSPDRSGDAVDERRQAELVTAIGASAVAELTASFLAATARRVVELDSLVAAGDIEGVQRIAHTVRGSSASLGLAALTSAAVNLHGAAANDLPLGPAVQELSAALSLTKRLVGQVDPQS